MLRKAFVWHYLIKSMKSFKPNEKIKENAYIGSIEKYNEIYDYSIKNPEGFWA